MIVKGLNAHYPPPFAPEVQTKKMLRNDRVVAVLRATSCMICLYSKHVLGMILSYYQVEFELSGCKINEATAIFVSANVSYSGLNYLQIHEQLCESFRVIFRSDTHLFL